MEELRSTEILDKEIQSDARRKAEAILKKAEEDCQFALNDVQRRIDVSKKEKEDFYARKIAAAKKDMEAAVPLEKQRFSVSFVQQEITDKINQYLKSLPVEKHIELVLSQIDFNSSTVKDKKLCAYVYGFDFSAVEKVLKKQLGSNLLKCEKTEFGKYVIEDEIGLECNEGIILETENKDFRCRLTMVQVISNLLDKNRAELSDALFGGNL